MSPGSYELESKRLLLGHQCVCSLTAQEKG